MNTAKPCPDRFDDIVALVMGALDPAAAEQLQDHIARCDACRQARDVLAAEEQEVRAGFKALTDRLGPVEQAVLEKHTPQPEVPVGASDNHLLERVKNMILAHKRLSVAAAATAAALAASMVLYVSLLSSPTPVYALEETVVANNHITTYHVKITPPATGTRDAIFGLGEAWVQVSPGGAPLRARMDLPKTEDGAKVVIFSAGKAEVWFKDKKGHTVIAKEDGLKMVTKLRHVADPKLLFEELQARKGAGVAQVATKEPAREGEPITLTVTYKDAPNKRQVCEVDPKTKLLQRVTTYRRQGDDWKQVELREYLEYNKEIDPKIFQLDLPKDVLSIDQIKRKPGLVKGDLSNEQIATKVVREFFEALIAKDYEKAGLILGGTPAERMKEMFARFKFFRVVEMGKPTSDPRRHALVVPIKVEWEIKDNKVVKQISLKVATTDEKRARTAVQAFYQALINEDAAAATRIAEEQGLSDFGFSPKGLKHDLERVRFLRIVELGKPSAAPVAGSVEVPVKVEFQLKGSSREVRQFSPAARAAEGQPDRWQIIGGI
jgi:hypothetical protein